MSLVLYESSEDGVGKITLNDPANLNAMGEGMAKEFSELVSRLRDDKSKPRALIITGAGRAFSAGGDLEMLDRKRSIPGEENRNLMLKFYNSFLSILTLKVPLIAAINGHAIGAGLCVACACDIRVAAEGAKLGVTFTKLGLHPGMGGTYFLPRLIGLAAATELMITGRVIDAAAAHSLGMVSKVLPPAEVVPEAEKIAQEISSCGPESVSQVLETLRGGHVSLSGALEREALCQSINYASPEFAEGVKATMEKRAPNFRV